MILKALYDYYERDPESVPYGYQLQSISFLIVIDENGKFQYIEDCRQENRGTNFFVPAGSHTNGKSPLLYWENPMYLLNYIPENEIVNPNDKQKQKIKKAKEKHLAFVERCKKVAEAANDKDLLAVCKFYELGEIDKVYNDNLWNVVKTQSSAWLSFRIRGQIDIITDNSNLLQFNSKSDDSHKGICLITGENAEIARLCANTPIIGSKNSAKLVSFNDSSYCSYNMVQGENSPISLAAEFAFSSSLKKLVSADSRNKFLIGNRTYLFWASSGNEVCSTAEECIFSLFGASTAEDNPNKQVEQVQKVFKSIYSGVLQTSLDDKFYILGLAPNSARIAVVYWAEIELKKFAGIISRHFDDMEIIDGRKDKKPYMGLRSILSAVALDGKSSEVSPNLPDAVVKSIFQGMLYPYTLYAACIRRIRAEQSLTITRAAIIKAYLNRLDNSEQKIDIMLDKENKNQGYLCGRLFAVLEKIQEEANNQHSIRERFMNSASATPVMVFPTILNLSSHHIEKLSEGRIVQFEKLKQEIVDKISADGFPAHLDLQDQGRFFVGYYHQRQDFFEKKTANN